MPDKSKTTKTLPIGARPYERCEAYGPQVLSDAELLAVIIRCGTRNINSIELATAILKLCSKEGNVADLCRLDIKQLLSINGIGRVKAMQILCICELSMRIAETKASKRLDFTNPKTIADYYMEKLRHLQKEQLVIVMLDSKCRRIADKVLSVGTVNASIITPREVFVEAIKNQSVSIILLHNHPSGDATPSRNDIEATKRIAESGHLLGIELLDHIIIGDKQYSSFKEMMII